MVVWIQNPFDALPSEGSRKLRYWLMAEAFVRAGHSVVLWTSDFSHVTKRPRQGLTSESAPFTVRFVPTPPYVRNVSFRRVRSHRAYARAWLGLAAAELPRPDVIVTSVPTLSAASAAQTLTRRFGARLVVDVMDAWPETFERLVPSSLRLLAHGLLASVRRTARRLYASADLVSGVSARYGALTGRADYRLAYHGIELDGVSAAEVPRSSGSGIRLVYAGNLGCTYDLATMMKAVAENEDFTLDVAGFGAADAAAFSTCDRVRFHGHLSVVDLRTLYAQGDVGIVPMADESWVGVPYKFADYASAGLRIASSLGGETAALLARYRCGANYAAGDSASLARAVRTAVALSAEDARRMCAAEFDARKIYDDYVRWVCS